MPGHDAEQRPGMWTAWAAIVMRLRFVFIALFLGITVLFALQLPKAELDTEMKNQLPKDLRTRIDLQRIEALFGGTDLAMIVVETADILAPSTLVRLQTLSTRMQRIAEFDRVVSLFTAKDLHAEDGEMIVEPALKRIPRGEQEKTALRKRLARNPLVYGNLLSKDFRYGVLIGFLAPGAKDEAVVGKLRALIADVPGPEIAYLGGMPVTRVGLTQDMRKDMRVFLPIGLLLMLVFLLVCFRQARGVILPFVVTVMSIVVAMGAIPLLGWKIHTVTILLPVILLAVANDYGIHLMARYQEDNAPGTALPARELASRGIVALGSPVLAAALTTMAGLLCLCSHVVIPAKQLGILAAWGVGFAALGSLLFIPAVLASLPRPPPVFGAPGGGQAGGYGVDRLLSRLAAGVPKRPRTVLVGAVVLALVVGSGATRLVVDTNPMSFYSRSQPAWRATHALNAHLGGWAGVSVVVEGDIKDPKLLRAIDDLEQHLKRHPLVGTTTSIAMVLRKMNRVMHDDDPAYDRIPETRELVAQYLLLYSMSGEPEDFEKLVDFPYRHAQLMAKVNDSGTQAATEVLRYTRKYLAQRFVGRQTWVGGFLDVMVDMVNHIVWGQVASMALAAVLVAALAGIALRSAVGGLLAVFPLLLALLMIFGIMGWAGIELNLVTALLSSIMIGVGVDYSIHFLWRYRDERHSGCPTRAAAVERTLRTAGRGIVFNALSVVVGFAVLVISTFYPVRFFGLLVAISVLASLAGALALLPAIVVLFGPGFLEPKPEAASPPREGPPASLQSSSETESGYEPTRTT